LKREPKTKSKHLSSAQKKESDTQTIWTKELKQEYERSKAFNDAFKAYALIRKSRPE